MTRSGRRMPRAVTLPRVEPCRGRQACPDCPGLIVMTNEVPWRDQGVWRFTYRPLFREPIRTVVPDRWQSWRMEIGATSDERREGLCRLAETCKEWSTYGKDAHDAERRLLKWLAGFAIATIRMCEVRRPPDADQIRRIERMNWQLQRLRDTKHEIRDMEVETADERR